MDSALETVNLGKRFRQLWALRECSVELPAGRVTALVGPNGAGKSTFMRLAAGLLRPDEGTLTVFGEAPGRHGTPRRLGYLAQDKPLYRSFTVAEMLRAGRRLNPGWDQAYAERLIHEADVPLTARVGTLSGGQRTRVALAVTLGRRPELVMLDEPLADLDPLARQEFMQALMAEVAETGMSVLMSSHVLSELDSVCDHLLLLAQGRILLAGDVEPILAEHQIMVGPAEGLPFPADTVIETRVAGRQATVMVRAPWSTGLNDWEGRDPTLEDLTLAYLRSVRTAGSPTREKVAA